MNIQASRGPRAPCPGVTRGAPKRLEERILPHEQIKLGREYAVELDERHSPPAEGRVARGGHRVPTGPQFLQVEQERGRSPLASVEHIPKAILC